MNRVASIVALGAALLTSGCVCFPYATPPMEVSGAVGPSTDDARVGVAAPLELTIKPAGAFTRTWDRRFDGGIGYRYVFLSDIPDLHGPTLRAGYLQPVSLKSPVDGESNLGLRFGYMAQSQLVVGSRVDEPGFGATFRFSAEWVRHSNGSFDTCAEESHPDPTFRDLDGDGYNDDEEDGFSCSFGNSFGESGVGLFAEATFLQVDSNAVGWVGFGLSLSFPASTGIAIASIFD